MTEPGIDQPWYSVRCLIGLGAISTGGGLIYEERVTVWRSNSFEDAIARAEHEATEYANAIDAEYLGLAQAYHLCDDIGDGAEVLSLMRDAPARFGRQPARHRAT